MSGANPERVEVAVQAVGLVAEDLGGGVHGRPEVRSHQLAPARELLAEAEVADDRALDFEEDVLGLEVSVEDVCVRRAYCGRAAS